MKKILFLDHDGVICLSSEWGSRFDKQKNGKIKDYRSKVDNFNPKCVKALNQIIKKTNCDIVVTSDWKNLINLRQMGLYYIEQGIIKKPIDYTDNFNYEKYSKFEFFNKKWVGFRPNPEIFRYLEIKEYIQRHPDIRYCIVDDLELGRSYIDYSIHYNRNWGFNKEFIKTYDYEGICKKGIKERIIEVLNS